MFNWCFEMRWSLSVVHWIHEVLELCLDVTSGLWVFILWIKSLTFMYLPSMDITGTILWLASAVSSVCRVVKLSVRSVNWLLSMTLYILLWDSWWLAGLGPFTLWDYGTWIWSYEWKPVEVCLSFITGLLPSFKLNPTITSSIRSLWSHPLSFL